MTNDEINAKIARLHGWEHLPPPAMPAWQRPTEHGMEELWDLPDYAGSTQYSSELIDEIVSVAGFSVTIEINGSSFLSSCKIYEDGALAVEFARDTAEEAICLAYIAWKERQAE